MSIEYRFKPLESWPGTRTQKRRHAPFRAGYGRTLIDMERELAHLGARTVVIQAECGDEDIRNDGRIRSSARMRGPGIIISFESKHGPLSYPCDTYADWTDNLRAIVLAMEALRAVDRYGVTRRGEQYRGWKQLPGGGEGGAIQAAEWVHVEDAARFLFDMQPKGSVYRMGENYRGRPIAAMVVAETTLNDVYRNAAKVAHPDAGGSDELMGKVNRARDFILAARH